MVGDPAHASGDPRAAGAGRGRSRRLASDRPAGPARLCPGAGRAHSPLTGRLRRSRPRSAAAPGLAPGPGGSRQAGGRHHGPSGPSRTPVVPDRQWRAVPVPVIAPGPTALRGSSLRWQRWVLPGRFLWSCRAGRGFVSRSAGAATTSPPAPQAGDHLIGVRPAHPVRTQPGHGGHGPRHQPDRTARKITIDFVSTRILTGDVARLAGCCEKATGVHEGKKEGGKQ